jgi:hypothetical protein
MLSSVANAQEQSPMDAPTAAKIEKLRKLEAQLKEIDQLGEFAKVQVKVEGDKESSLIVKITAVQVPLSAETTQTSKAGKSETAITLFNLNLTEADIPDEYVDQKIKEFFDTPSRCGSIPSVVISQIGVSPNYKVEQDYFYQAPNYRVTVFKDFVYDRASIPRVFWVIIDKDSLGNVAPLLHDLLYRHGGALPANQISPHRNFSREDTDKLFLEIMTKCGVGFARREAAYLAVRAASGFAWKGK